MMLIGSIVAYILASLVTVVALLTDKERIEWYIVLGLTVGWPVAIPFAAGWKLAENIKDIREHKRLLQRNQMLRFCRVAFKVGLISHDNYGRILKTN